MSINELNLIAAQKTNLPVNKIFGALEIVGAPMLLLQSLFGNMGTNADLANGSKIISALGVLYIGGWICGAIGMFRQKVYGETAAARIVFTIQMILLVLAFLFSVQETLGTSYENGSGLFFAVCDAGYPLSHLFMIVVGIYVWRGKNWKGFQRFAPFLVGAALPLTCALMPFFGMSIGLFSFCGLTNVGLAVIGYSVYTNRK